MSKALEHLRSEWREAGAESSGGALADVRSAAFERFAETGFPGPRAEQWRQLNVAALARRPLAIARPKLAVLDDAVLAALDALRSDGPLIVLVNGRYQPDLSDALPGGVTLRALSTGTLTEDEATAALTRSESDIADPRAWAFADLNTALAPDLVELAFEGSIDDLAAPPQIACVASAGVADAVSCPRLILRIGSDVRAHLVEHSIAGRGERPLAIGFTRVEAAAGSTLKYEIADHHGEGAGRIGRTEIVLAEHAQVAVHANAIGDGLVRADVVARLAEPHAGFEFRALALGRGRQHLEYLVDADHAAPHTTSDQIFKAIGKDRSRAVFTSRAKVAEDAQHIDSKQLSRGLILSPGAQINTRPQLEIYADDVVCAHGATVGQLDEDALFYLRSRGVPVAQARAMLLDAFVEDLIGMVGTASVRDAVRTRAYAFTHVDDPDTHDGDDA